MASHRGGEVEEIGRRLAVKGKGALLLALGGVAACALLLAACGSEEGPSTAPATPASGAPAAEVTPTPALEAPEQVVGNLPAVGVYPTTVEFESVLRGNEYLRTIGVMNGSDSEQTFRFEIDGEAGPWLSVVNPQDQTQALDTVLAPPRGEGRAFLRLVVPPDVPNGVHSGAVRVLTAVRGGELGVGAGAGASVSVGAKIDVTFDVTGTQNIAGSLVDVATTDVEIGLPLRVNATIQNSGNVQVNPQIDLQVMNPDGTVVGEASSADNVVYPNEIKVLTPEWDTTGQQLGEHTARVSVKFGDLDIGTREAHFNILAVGTLTRSGELEGLSLEGKPSAGSVAKVVASFRNTGQIDTRAQFSGEVFRDSVRVDTATSEEVLVERGGGVAPLELFVPVPENGTYTVRGKVNYEGKETDVQELTFRVGAAEGEVPFFVWIVGGAAVVVVALIALGWIMGRRLSKKLTL
jgi:hypothetical protein